ncbi:MAG: F0F1 ATP synthase subunit epsilon [Dehalococcoidia bacterium]|nr:F0F1 ATP synthase subunit epsilon [Dehalococcoidia bacterium]
MTTLNLEIITAERVVYSADVEMLVAPGVEGQLGILPFHAPLMTVLTPGELVVRVGGEETHMAVTGGFLEVRPDKVVVLADAAERAEEIDVDRAEAAMKRAEERLKSTDPGMDLEKTEAALWRSLTRLKVAEIKGRRKRERA